MSIPESELIVTPSDARAAGYCVSGMRKWFSEAGLDFRTFCRGTMTAAEVRSAVGDNALLDRVIEQARSREATDGR